MSLLERKKWLAKILKKAPPASLTVNMAKLSDRWLAAKASSASFRSEATRHILLAIAAYG